MSKVIQVQSKCGSLRLNRRPTPRQFLTEFQNRLRLFFDTNKTKGSATTPISLMLGATTVPWRTTSPTYDIGPALEPDDHIWGYWDSAHGKYFPVKQTAYDTTSGFKLTLGTESLTADRVQSVQAKNGLIALTRNIYVPRPPSILDASGVAVSIDTSPVPGPGLDDPFGHDMFIIRLKKDISLFTINMLDGESIVVALINEGSAWDFTWSTVKWPGGVAPTTPHATGGETAVGLYEIRKIGTSYYGKSHDNIGSSIQYTPGGPSTQPPKYGYIPPVERQKNLP